VAGRACRQTRRAEVVAVQVCYTRCGVQGNVLAENRKRSSCTAAPTRAGKKGSSRELLHQRKLGSHSFTFEPMDNMYCYRSS
jgi:hypothetical protein